MRYVEIENPQTGAVARIPQAMTMAECTEHMRACRYVARGPLTLATSDRKVVGPPPHERDVTK